MMKIDTRLFALLTLCLAGPLGLQAQITEVATFNGADGQNPVNGVVLSPDGTTLYGSTYNGGANGDGAVFSVPVGGGTPTLLASFNDSDGSRPQGGLVLSADGTTLYGTTYRGGADGAGVVFSVPVSGGTPTVLANFNGGDGSLPMAQLIRSGNTLYGTTSTGGLFNHGAVFSLPVGGGTPTVLTSFNVSNGSMPMAGLALNGGILYGTTYAGGAFSHGVVFSVPVGGGTPTVLTNFYGSAGPNPDGGDPEAGVVVSGGTLYGTTTGDFLGDTQNGPATVFSLPISGGTPTTLATITIGEGMTPTGLVLSPDGKTLYSATSGSNGVSLIFSLPVGGGSPTILGDFIGSGIDSGVSIPDSLVLGGDVLYGVTSGGGPDADGTVFSVPDSVPEPGSAGLLLAGALGMIARRRRGGGAYSGSIGSR